MTLMQQPSEFVFTTSDPRWDLRKYLEINDLNAAAEDAVATKVWVDVETTGLAKNTVDHVLEIGMVATTDELDVISVFHSFVYDTPWLMSIASTTPVVFAMHTQSGLFVEYQHARTDGEGANDSDLAPTEVQDRAFEWFEGLGLTDDPGPVMCGNSIDFDRRMLFQDLPDLEAFFHYRSINVSSFKEECRRLAPRLYDGEQEMEKDFEHLPEHRALFDIAGSLREMRFYHTNFLYI